MGLLNTEALKRRVEDYHTGWSDALLDQSLLQRVRMRRRQLGQMTMALDRELARVKIPAGDYHISRKVDGEFTCLVYNEGEVFTINPGGSIRMGAPMHEEARKVLDECGVKFALLGGELYVRRSDDRRPRVHDVVRVARAPESAEDVASLCIALFNIYEWDDEQRSGQYADRYDRLNELFGNGDRVHPVETIIGEGSKAVLSQFKKWVDGEGAEGVVARSDTAGVFKVKPRHTIDLAAIGFTEGLDDRSGLLHDVMLAVVRQDGTFHIIGRVGGGFSDDQRAEILQRLEARVVDSEYAEVNSDRVAYRMIEPGLVFEISCLDVIANTSRGNTIDKMVLEWNEDERIWEGVRRLPLCSVISPQFLRIRDDKSANADDVRFSQLTDIVNIPSANVVSEELKLPASSLIKRAVATKALRGATMVRKLLMWKTNKSAQSSDYPEYVLHLTDYSPNRKDPLKHEIRVSSSEQQVLDYWKQWEKKYFVSGWSTL
jgi:ATP-dependent DNA ligase